MKREPVASHREQDNWLHRLLQQRAATQQAAVPTSACLDADVLAAWADGALSAKERAAAETHVAKCRRCLALLAAIERTAPAVVAEPHPRRMWIRWLVPLTAAATAVAIWIAIPQQRVTPVAREVASTSAPATPPPFAPPVEAPQPKVPPPQPQAMPQQAPSARVEEPAEAEEDRLARQERALADSVAVAESARARENAEVGQSTFSAPAPPAAPAPPGLANEGVAATTPQKALDKVSIIEGASSGDPRIRWRVLSGIDVERSTDGGKTWTSASKPPAPISGIHVMDALNASVTTSDGRSFSTTDGGATWAPVQEKPAAPF